MTNPNAEGVDFVRGILEPGQRLLSRTGRLKISTEKTNAICAARLSKFFKGKVITRSGVVSPRRQVNAAAIEQYWAYRKRTGVTDLTIKRELAVGQRCVNVMRRTQGLDIPNPFENINPFEDSQRFRKREAEIRAHWSSEDIEKFLATARPIVRDIVEFGLHTGCSISEILKLVETSRYRGETYQRIVERDGTHWLVFSPHDQRSGQDALCRLNSTALTILERQQRAEVAEFDDQGNPILHKYLFSFDEHQIKRDRFRWWFKQDRNSAGLPHVQFKHLRKTCAQRMIDDGASLADVQKQLRFEKFESVEQMFGYAGVRRR